ncbi:MAG: hypothetical protein ACTSWY_09145 [Promethearchaeota archaeon]
MNEAEIIIFLLSQKRNDMLIGASEKELLKVLALTDRNAKFKLLNLLDEINSNIVFLGLKIKYNPANGYWFITFKDNISSLIPSSSNNNLPSRLAATLFSILLISISKGGPIQTQNLAEIRNKKSIQEDIQDLEKMKFIKSNRGTVSLTPKIFYYIDIENIVEEINKFNINNELGNPHSKETLKDKKNKERENIE